MDIIDDLVIITNDTGKKLFYTNKKIKENINDKTILRLFRKLDGYNKVKSIERKNIKTVETRLNRNSHYFFKAIKIEALLKGENTFISFICYIYDFNDYIKKL